MRKFIYLTILVLAIGGAYGVYLFNKKPVNPKEHDADFTVSAIDLLREFNSDEPAATKKYAGRILLVSGVVLDVNSGSSTVFLDASDALASVTCSFAATEISSLQNIHKGESVQVKGVCTGKLIDVILNNCSLYRSSESSKN